MLCECLVSAGGARKPSSHLPFIRQRKESWGYALFYKNMVYKKVILGFSNSLKIQYWILRLNKEFSVFVFKVLSMYKMYVGYLLTVKLLLDLS